jgi:hypothetical protein
MKKIVLALILIMSGLSLWSQGLVISEIFGGGGSSGATFKSDYVELYNSSNADIVMTNWSVQYASATGSNWQVATFSGTIKAKSYFLVEQAVGSSGADIPIGDAKGNISVSATNAKIALVSNNTALTGVNPQPNAAIVDFVGYGTANAFEGNSAFSALNATTAAERKANSSSTTASMSAGGADEFAGNSYDTNNNNADFVTRSPNPQNSASPSEGGSNNAPILTVTAGSLNFGSITINTVSQEQQFSLNTANLTNDVLVKAPATFKISKIANGTYLDSLTYTKEELQSPRPVFVRFYPTQITSYNGNIQITSEGLPSLAVAVRGEGNAVGNYIFDFNLCTGSISDGFTQFSIDGAQTWLCTTFGRDATSSSGTGSAASGVQMSGFANSASAPNEDWLISPAIDILTGTSNFPLLSFYSRSRFSGEGLQLRVSENYLGTGSPTATGVIWNTLNGKFPAVDSDVWTLSSDINLSEYKGKRIYLAWIYVSTANAASRWTLDDVSIINSLTPPSPYLSIDQQSIAYDFTQNGTSKVDSINIIGENLAGAVRFETKAPFALSLNNVTFDTIVNLPVTSGGVNAKVYVRFRPTLNAALFEGNINVRPIGLADRKILLQGNSLDPDASFDVVNWNIEWFSGTNGPTDDLLQEKNALTLMRKMDADVYACTEIVDTLAFKALVDSLGSKVGDYKYFVSKYASNASDINSVNYATGQKLAFAYRASIVTPIKVEPIFYTADASAPIYNFWASGRFPYMMEADVKMNGITKRITFIVIHAKAQNSTDAYLRRQNAAIALKSYMDTNLSKANIVLLGDFNDDLDFTIAPAADTGGDFPKSSYSVIVDDSVNYIALTLPLSRLGERSTASFPNVIDHVMVSDDFFPTYVQGTAQILNELSQIIPSFPSTTSDHYPVLSRYLFDPRTTTKEITKNAGDVKVYPNPLSDELNIEIKFDGGSARKHIILMDVSGKLHYAEYSYADKLVIPTSKLASGMYILSVSNDAGRVTRKVVKL